MDRDYTKTILYKGGYKYQLAKVVNVQVSIFPPETIHAGFLILAADGVLTIKAGYAWDGPSGPTIDTSNFMRGSLVHDALYQLMRGDYIGHEKKELADQLLRRICIEDGMSRIRAWWVYHGVKYFAGRYIKASAHKPIHYAP